MSKPGQIGRGDCYPPTKTGVSPYVLQLLNLGSRRMKLLGKLLPKRPAIGVVVRIVRQRAFRCPGRFRFDDEPFAVRIEFVRHGTGAS